MARPITGHWLLCQGHSIVFCTVCPRSDADPGFFSDPSRTDYCDYSFCRIGVTLRSHPVTHGRPLHCGRRRQIELCLVRGWTGNEDMDEGFVWLCTTSVLSRFNRPGLVFVLPVTNLWLLPLRRRITFEENVLHRNQA